MLVDWETVQPGDIVKGKDGHPWSVILREGATVTLARDGREPFSGKPTGQVEVISSAATEEAAAETAAALVAVRLGGEAIASQDAQGRWYTPVELPSPASLLAHAYVFHGLTLEDASLKVLAEQHARLHDVEQTVGYLEPHVHSPDFDRVRVALTPADAPG